MDRRAKKTTGRSAKRVVVEQLRKSVGENLLVVRQVLAMGQGEFGARAGLAPNTYNQIENGQKLPSVPVAIAIADAHGLTLDYIYRGDASDLDKTTRDAIDPIHTLRAHKSLGKTTGAT